MKDARCGCPECKIIRPLVAALSSLLAELERWKLRRDAERDRADQAEAERDLLLESESAWQRRESEKYEGWKACARKLAAAERVCATQKEALDDLLSAGAALYDELAHHGLSPHAEDECVAGAAMDWWRRAALRVGDHPGETT
jgi:hypothetical protein